jgi:murein DD-endopeptidase MepM/ murein hydrolase activator NlpD
VIAAGTVSSAPAADFSLQSSSVKPRKAFFDADGGVRIAFRFAAPGPTDVSVRIDGKRDRAYELKQLRPGETHRLRWDGLNNAGKAAPDGIYRVRVGPTGSRLAPAGKLRLVGHRYPVRGRHGGRGGVGEFGAARDGGRIHRGFDVTARCGTPLVAVRGGTVVRRRFHPRLDGNFVVISGRKQRRTYRYSHLTRPAKVTKGERVFTGQLLGFVGRTGNAASTPCHLHFEIRARGRGFRDPEPFLRAWDRFS